MQLIRSRRRSLMLEIHPERGLLVRAPLRMPQKEIEAFLLDTRPGAYERVVDHLLSSPRHGEHHATTWLDAARYADTSGYQNDGPRSMWRWRDWVLDAINANMPFDQFTVEQLAGDLLPEPTLEQRIATGFNRSSHDWMMRQTKMMH